MTKTREIEAWLWRYLFILAIGCSQGDHSPVKEAHPNLNCGAAEVAHAVGDAVVAGDARNLRPMLMTGASLAWLQRASDKSGDTSFDERVYAAAAKDVAAWAVLSKGGQVVDVQLGPTLHNQTMEGFARATDVIDGSIVLVGRKGQTTRVRIQHLFLIDGCWRIANIGSPKEQ